MPILSFSVQATCRTQLQHRNHKPLEARTCTVHAALFGQLRTKRRFAAHWRWTAIADYMIQWEIENGSSELLCYIV